MVGAEFMFHKQIYWIGLETVGRGEGTGESQGFKPFVSAGRG